MAYFTCINQGEMMRIKNILLANIIAATLLTSNIAMAETIITPPAATPPATANLYPMPSFGGMLSPTEQTEVANLMNVMRAQMIPLLKNERALDLQLKGKIATPNTQLSDLAPLINDINTNHGKIETLKTKTQLDIYQKFGVMVPDYLMFPPFQAKMHH